PQPSWAGKLNSPVTPSGKRGFNFEGSSAEPATGISADFAAFCFSRGEGDGPSQGQRHEQQQRVHQGKSHVATYTDHCCDVICPKWRRRPCPRSRLRRRCGKALQSPSPATKIRTFLP